MLGWAFFSGLMKEETHLDRNSIIFLRMSWFSGLKNCFYWTWLIIVSYRIFLMWKWHELLTVLGGGVGGEVAYCVLGTEVYLSLFFLFSLALKTVTMKPAWSANFIRGSETCLLGLLMILTIYPPHPWPSRQPSRQAFFLLEGNWIFLTGFSSKVLLVSLPALFPFHSISPDVLCVPSESRRWKMTG